MNTKKARVLLVTPNLKGIKDGLNRIQPPLGLMLIAQTLIDEGHIVKIHDFALEGWDNRVDIDVKNNLVLIAAQTQNGLLLLLKQIYHMNVKKF